MTFPSADLSFRLETPGNVAAVRAVVTEAFGQTDEANLVDRLRVAGALVLAGVAEVNGKIVGHIAYSRVKVEEAGTQSEALALAPVAVLPEWQRRGVGSALIRWSLEEIARLGCEIVIVLGHPGYYPRFGFVPAAQHRIRCPFPAPEEAFLVLEMKPGALAKVRGTVCYHPAFTEV